MSDWHPVVVLMWWPWHWTGLALGIGCTLTNEMILVTHTVIMLRDKLV